jgi:uncharacterized protein YbjT (DUF2867 family)
LSDRQSRSSPGLTALLAGATGLVGGELLRGLLTSRHYARIVVLTRRPLPGAASAKLHSVVTDFEQLGSVREELAADHVFCALGTTIARAGSRAAFRQVDHEYVLRVAQLARMQGARHFSVVSALGARAGSPFFYSRVKGEVELALRQMGWPSLAILRPSVISGQRAESRPLERLGEGLLAHGPTAWRPVPARDIATAMLALALRGADGVTVVESKDIAALVNPAR